MDIGKCDRFVKQWDKAVKEGLKKMLNPFTMRPIEVDGDMAKKMYTDCKAVVKESKKSNKSASSSSSANRSAKRLKKSTPKTPKSSSVKSDKSVETDLFLDFSKDFKKYATFMYTDEELDEGIHGGASLTKYERKKLKSQKQRLIQSLVNASKKVKKYKKSELLNTIQTMSDYKCSNLIDVITQEDISQAEFLKTGWMLVVPNENSKVGDCFDKETFITSCLRTFAYGTYPKRDHMYCKTPQGFYIEFESLFKIPFFKIFKKEMLKVDTIGTNFGVSNTHGIEETIYKLVPVESVYKNVDKTPDVPIEEIEMSPDVPEVIPPFYNISEITPEFLKEKIFIYDGAWFLFLVRDALAQSSLLATWNPKYPNLDDYHFAKFPASGFGLWTMGRDSIHIKANVDIPERKRGSKEQLMRTIRRALNNLLKSCGLVLEDVYHFGNDMGIEIILSYDDGRPRQADEIKALREQYLVNDSGEKVSLESLLENEKFNPFIREGQPGDIDYDEPRKEYNPFIEYFKREKAK